MISTLTSYFEAMDAVVRNGLMLEYVSDEFKNSPGIVMPAIAQNPLALKFAGTKLRGFKSEDSFEARKLPIEIVVFAVSRNGLAIQHAGHRTKDMADIVRIALRQNPLALEYCTGHKDVAIHVLYAVEHNGLALQYASDALRARKDVVMAAFNQNQESAKFINFHAKWTLETIEEMVKENPAILPYFKKYIEDNYGKSERILRSGESVVDSSAVGNPTGLKKRIRRSTLNNLGIEQTVEVIEIFDDDEKSTTSGARPRRNRVKR